MASLASVFPMSIARFIRTKLVIKTVPATSRRSPLRYEIPLNDPFPVDFGCQFAKVRSRFGYVFYISNYNRQLIIVLFENKFTVGARRDFQDVAEYRAFVVGRMLVFDEFQDHDAVFDDRFLEPEFDAYPPHPNDVEQLAGRFRNRAETVDQIFLSDLLRENTQCTAKRLCES